jgi:hypothetical protein
MVANDIYGAYSQELLRQKAINNQQSQQQLHQQVPQQVPQRPTITVEIQRIAMQTERGRKAYEDWTKNRAILIIQILKNTPEGLLVYQKFEDELMGAYNDYIVAPNEDLKKLQKQIEEANEKIRILEGKQ